MSRKNRVQRLQHGEGLECQVQEGGKSAVHDLSKGRLFYSDDCCGRKTESVRGGDAPGLYGAAANDIPSDSGVEWAEVADG